MKSVSIPLWSVKPPTFGHLHSSIAGRYGLAVTVVHFLSCQKLIYPPRPLNLNCYIWLELWIYAVEQFKTRDEAKAAIFEYIEVFYNRRRKHSSNNYKVPMEFMNAA